MQIVLKSLKSQFKKYEQSNNNKSGISLPPLLAGILTWILVDMSFWLCTQKKPCHNSLS